MSRLEAGFRKAPRRQPRLSKLRRLLTYGLLISISTAIPAQGQQPQWRPTRLPANSEAQRLPPRANSVDGNHAWHAQTTHAQLNSHVQNVQGQPQENLGSGVVLRWKSTSSSSHQVQPATSAQQAFVQPASANASGNLNAQYAFSEQTADVDTSAIRHGQPNPLRSAQSSPVRTVNYQEPINPAPLGNPPLGNAPLGNAPLGNAPLGNPPANQQLGNPPPGIQLPQGNDPFNDPFNNAGQAQADPTQLPAIDPNQLPQLPNLNNGAPATPPSESQQIPGTQDPLQAPEAAPAPSSVLENQTNPFPNNNAQSPDTSASDQANQGTANGEGDGLDLPSRTQDANSLSCNESRERLRSRSILDVTLDVSPSFGEGLRSVNKDTEQQRLEFAESSKVRDWQDYTGRIVATGRLIDLRNDRVVLDVNGSEQTYPIRDLSDVDLTYVGEQWNIPLKCGTGNEPYAGRNFIASSVQWTAPGHCHKPLYFEQMQLERYGHEVGPVLQPLLSTAHFFGNIPVLPYKMGIHPPNECQYSLGYYRPGNCAPYMMRPIPWSLRGAVTQAGFVTGLGALVP